MEVNTQTTQNITAKKTELSCIPVCMFFYKYDAKYFKFSGFCQKPMTVFKHFPVNVVPILTLNQHSR